MKQWIVQKHPQNGRWYVLGYCGRSLRGRAQYMPVSDGYTRKEHATEQIEHLRRAVVAARVECAV